MKTALKSAAVHLIRDGLSLRDVADFIKREYHIKVSHVSINNWMKREKLSAPVVAAVMPPAKTELGMFGENDGFDYRSKHPKRVGSSEVYHSGTGKIVIRHRGKGCRGEIVLAAEKDIGRLLSYDEKDFEWCIKNLNHEKRNILRGYLRDLRMGAA